ncbi:MAG: 4Fe-4S dicluster domain-containing protein [Candidatus Lokiarchaeota archaeon]|nr:4Fe-4S dicluster domain-containing protein [Candidatus Lokiarchaeota archaeon]MBD3201538.1 4Fe-4S dicluster domain-containing protein [Candidatus Lokiarchaeota archaeon]
MSKSERKIYFDENACTRCGVCLNRCPVLSLPIEKAREEIIRLVEGKKSEYALSACNTCFSCNLYCKADAHPYQLILERWNDQYRDIGAPPLYKFVCPTEFPNIWQLLNGLITNKERIWIKNWVYSKPNSNDTLLLIGNYTHLFPFIIGGSRILDYFTPIDLIDHWEGGAYLYQGGFLDVVQRIAEKTKADFDNIGARKIVATLDAVEYIYEVVHPREMGVKHDQEFENLNEFLLKKIELDEITLKKNLNLDVTVHDNCYSKVEGGKYWDTPRKLLKKAGCNIKEMKHIKKDSLCCGFGAGASWVNNISIPFDIIYEGKKKFEEALATGADALVTYCGGCLYLLWATKELLEYDIELFHILEIVRLSMGEKLNYPEDNINRAWDIITIITYQLLISLFQRNFYISKIEYDEKKSSLQPKKFILLKIIRRLFDFKIMRKIYSRFFRILMPILKTR